MAIATLARIYNNYDVFKKEVKIRKGEAVQIMMYGGNYETIIGYFNQYIKEVRRPTHLAPLCVCETYVRVLRLV
jgi:farnesyl-diphosphate farnesyltransferase